MSRKYLKMYKYMQETNSMIQQMQDTRTWNMKTLQKVNQTKIHIVYGLCLQAPLQHSSSALLILEHELFGV